MVYRGDIAVIMKDAFLFTYQANLLIIDTIWTVWMFPLSNY